MGCTLGLDNSIKRLAKYKYMLIIHLLMLLGYVFLGLVINLLMFTFSLKKS